MSPSAEVEETNNNSISFIIYTVANKRMNIMENKPKEINELKRKRKRKQSNQNYIEKKSAKNRKKTECLDTLKTK